MKTILKPFKAILAIIIILIITIPAMLIKKVIMFMSCKLLKYGDWSPLFILSKNFKNRYKYGIKGRVHFLNELLTVVNNSDEFTTHTKERLVKVINKCIDSLQSDEYKKETIEHLKKNNIIKSDEQFKRYDNLTSKVLLGIWFS